ncbi:ATP-binding protein [Euzebya sp.]|uniref:ATP-binding protein n=1 Tax=Euzebya sp. TaxID=1971409 RepID=UPI0035157E39
MQVRLRNPDRTVEVAGPRRVTEVLAELDINPETVLVIVGDELVTSRETIDDDAVVEIRPVISGGAGGGGRCRQCGERPAVIDIARHRTRYCGPCFVDHVRTQVRHAIDEYGMFGYDDDILVAVSGGKDSLALWDVLLDMGYRVSGLYLGLGIGGYSNRSEQLVRDFAAARGARLHVEDLADTYGFDIGDSVANPRPGDRKRGRVGRAACGTCGLSKRYVFNKVAIEHGYDVMATGHNLDDEASQLLGNVLRWDTGFMARQSPLLPARDEMARKVKPLYRLTERETAAYCVIKGLDYVVEECPLVEGNTVMRYKDVLNTLEQAAPGTKAHFLFGFLDRVRDQHFAGADAAGGTLVPCDACGLPTTAHAEGETPVCAFCRTRGRLLAVLGGPDRDAHAEASA